MLYAQRTITGTVTSAEDRDGLPGVQVLVRGTTTGTVTDFAGHYSINVPNDATHLVFSFMGMANQEVAIDGRTAINVLMQSDARQLAEVVVTGFGTARRPGTVIGSFQQVTSETLQARPAANVMDGLQGQVAGLQVFTNSGEPGAPINVRLHGVGSLGASSAPLFIVDGIQVSQDAIVSMNPNDFESVTVLKDASATSIFGARAANGVVVITTKRGLRGQDAQITIRTQYGISRLAERDFFNNMMNANEYFAFQVASGNNTQAWADATRAAFPYDTNWLDVFMRDNVPTSQTDISIRGGGGRTSYFISGSHFDQEGTAWGSFFNRFTGRANIESQAKDWLRVGMNMMVGRDRRRSNGFFGAASLNGGLATMNEPFRSPVDENGNRRDWIDGLFMHPEYIAENSMDISTNSQFIGSFFVELSPIEGLTLISRSGTEASDMSRDFLRKPSWSNNNPITAGGRGLGATQRITMTTNNVAEYRFTINDQHNITALAGQEWIVNDTRQNYTTINGLLSDNFTLLQHGDPATLVATSSRTEFAFLSFFGRLDYNFNERFFADFSLRNDASSRFGVENRNAWFWAAGGMWNMTNENFIRNIRPITDARVMISYGTQGNAEIGNYTHLALIGTTTMANTVLPHVPQYGGGMAWTMTQPGNRFLTWESQSKLTVGFRTELLNRYSIEVDFYRRSTEAMLINVPLPFTTGFANNMENVGTMTNTGFDIVLGMDFIRTRDYFFGASVVYNYNVDRVTQLFGGLDRWEIPNTGLAWVVGSPVMHYRPIHAGVNPDTGRQQWYKPNGRDNTTMDPNNVTDIFSANDLIQNTGRRLNAPHNGGFSLFGGWRGFTMNADFAFVLGKWMLCNTTFFTSNPVQFPDFNQSRDVMDFWTEDNRNARYPDWRQGQAMQFDTHLLSNASFMRLKNLTVSYNLPESVIERTEVLSNVRLFATGRNLFTFTNFIGIDPEVDANLATGTYANSMQFQVGIEVVF